jgi:hypothetical protein
MVIHPPDALLSLLPAVLNADPVWTEGHFDTSFWLLFSLKLLVISLLQWRDSYGRPRAM